MTDVVRRFSLNLDFNGKPLRRKAALKKKI